MPDDGWFFRQWTGDVTSTDNPAEIVMNGAKAVTGVFTPPRLVAVGYNGCRVVSTDGMTWTDYMAPGGGFLRGHRLRQRAFRGGKRRRPPPCLHGRRNLDE